MNMNEETIFRRASTIADEVNGVEEPIKLVLEEENEEIQNTNKREIIVKEEEKNSSLPESKIEERKHPMDLIWDDEDRFKKPNYENKELEIKVLEFKRHMLLNVKPTKDSVLDFTNWFADLIQEVVKPLQDETGIVVNTNEGFGTLKTKPPTEKELKMIEMAKNMGFVEEKGLFNDYSNAVFANHRELSQQERNMEEDIRKQIGSFDKISLIQKINRQENYLHQFKSVYNNTIETHLESRETEYLSDEYNTEVIDRNTESSLVKALIWDSTVVNKNSKEYPEYIPPGAHYCMSDIEYHNSKAISQRRENIKLNNNTAYKEDNRMFAIIDGGVRIDKLNWMEEKEYKKISQQLRMYFLEYRPEIVDGKVYEFNKVLNSRIWKPEYIESEFMKYEIMSRADRTFANITRGISRLINLMNIPDIHRILVKQSGIEVRQLLSYARLEEDEWNIKISSILYGKYENGMPTEGNPRVLGDGADGLFDTRGEILQDVDFSRLEAYLNDLRLKLYKGPTDFHNLMLIMHYNDVIQGMNDLILLRLQMLNKNLIENEIPGGNNNFLQELKNEIRVLDERRVDFQSKRYKLMVDIPSIYKDKFPGFDFLYKEELILMGMSINNN